MNLSDIIRIPNTDISDIMCMEKNNIIYMKESAITQLAEENRIEDIDALCKHIMESCESDRAILGYKLIRDVNAPWIVVSESYEPKIEDPIMEEFAIWEGLVDLFYEADYAQSQVAPEANVTNQKISLVMERILSHIKKTDYDEPAEIQRRIKDIDTAINKLKKEQAEVEKRKAESKENQDKDKRIYNAGVFVSAISGLASGALSYGAGVAASKVLVPKSKMLSNWFGSGNSGDSIKKRILSALHLTTSAGIGAATAIFSYQSYKDKLSSSISSLEGTKSFLENEYQKALKRQSKKDTKNNKTVKESTYGDSIQHISGPK